MLAEQQEKLFVSELRRGFVFPLFAFQYPLSTTSDQIIHLINFLRDMFTSCKTSSSSYGNKYSSSAFSNIFFILLSPSFGHQKLGAVLKPVQRFDRLCINNKRIFSYFVIMCATFLLYLCLRWKEYVKEYSKRNKPMEIRKKILIKHLEIAGIIIYLQI